MKKTTEQQEIAYLKALSDENIDTSDIPEVKNWSNAEAGKFYRPVKKQITLRLDADMLDWFRNQGNGYQTIMNEVLRQYMGNHKPKEQS